MAEEDLEKLTQGTVFADIRQSDRVKLMTIEEFRRDTPSTQPEREGATSASTFGSHPGTRVMKLIESAFAPVTQ